MSRRFAPSARRMPISRVRSVMVASMMFMMPMPPTIREIAAMEPSTMFEDALRPLLLLEQLEGHDHLVVLSVVEVFEQPRIALAAAATMSSPARATMTWCSSTRSICRAPETTRTSVLPRRRSKS